MSVGHLGRLSAPARAARRPVGSAPLHLALEVIWTSGGLDKLEIYRKLRVREVWIWRKGRLVPHVLAGDRYLSSTRSEVLPGIDLVQLVSFLDRPTTSQAIRDYRAALESKE